MSTRNPSAIVFAGPNGSGKSSAAGALVAGMFPIDRLVNPDTIARAINPSDPTAARIQAGRAALQAVVDHTQARRDFALETTLSGRMAEKALRRITASGYDITMYYLWLPSPDLAIARVRGRASRGEHDVPPEDVRRRYYRSLVNLEDVGMALATRWSVLDARAPGPGTVVAQGTPSAVSVHAPSVWTEVLASIAAARKLVNTPQIPNRSRGT
jgi:predicted ABC-type ATPase